MPHPPATRLRADEVSQFTEIVLLNPFFLFAALWLASAPTWAADWFVCPDTRGEYGAEDGRSLANCFDGADDLRLSDVSPGPGDTIFVCGDFTAADARFIIEHSGAAGTYLTISGNAEACGRTTNSSISRAGVTGVGGRALSATGRHHVKIAELTLRDCDQYCLSWDYRSSPGENTALWVDEVSFLNCRGTTSPGDCLWKRGAELLVTRSTFDRCHEDCIWFRGKNVTISDSVFKNVSAGGINGDATQVDLTGIANAGYVRWFNNYCDHRLRDNKYCFVVGPVAGTGSSVSVYDNRVLCPPGGSAGKLSCHPLYLDVSAATVVDVHGNWVEGGYNGISVTAASAVTLTTRGKVYANVIRRAANRGIWLDGNINALDVTNNAVDGANIGLHIGRADADITAVNNVFVNNGIGLYYVSEPSARGYNAYSGNGVAISESGVVRPLTTSDKSGNPGFVGGASPVEPEGYQLGSSSALRSAGTVVGAQTDYFGCRYNAARPAIGPVESCQGDIIDARSLRY